MTESIIIKDAGPLRHVAIDRISPVTLLIGESGSGKSVFMKALLLMRYIYKMLNIRATLKNAGLKSPFKLNLSSLLKDDLALYFGPGKSGEIQYSTHDGRYTLRIANGKLITKEAENISAPDLVFLKESWITEMRSAIPMWLARPGAFKEAGFYFKETADDFDKALDAVTDLAMPHIGMHMRVKRVNDKRRVMLAPDNATYDALELRNASSGMQSSAPVVALTRYFAREFSFKDALKRSIVDYLFQQDRLTHYRPDIEPADIPRIVHMHIEEPELSLYPSAQCAMMEDIVKTALNPAADRSLSIIMATHSPYIVNYMNILLSLPHTDPAALSGENLGIYRIADGQLQNLMARTPAGRWIVDSTAFTEPMTDILSRYRSLNS
ncbi:MAG: ATP-binding protein [Muribaculaceae bacterium]|nr:ATP-binding protein [Muribaculaceae bacterium]